MSLSLDQPFHFPFAETVLAPFRTPLTPPCPDPLLLVRKQERQHGAQQTLVLKKRDLPFLHTLKPSFFFHIPISPVPSTSSKPSLSSQSIPPSPSSKDRVKKRFTRSLPPSFTRSKIPLLVFLSRTSKGIREEFSPLKVVNLDFDARVPIPFSIFPSSYRSDDVATTSQTHVEGEINLPQEQRVGREGQYSFSAEANLPPRNEQFQEEVHIHREEEHHHRPSRREDIYIRDERRYVN